MKDEIRGSLQGRLSGVLAILYLASRTTVEAATADLLLTASAAPNPVVTGGNLTFTYLMTNRGPETATGVLLTNRLPPSLILSTAITTNGSWTYSNGTFHYYLDSLPTGVPVMINVVVVPVNTQTITNRASLVANETDPVLGNNLNRFTPLVRVVPVAGGPNLVIHRHLHTATTLTDGRVLITGGWTNHISGAVSRTSELFDPRLESFSLAGPMSFPRIGHTATLLTNGMVLVAGGKTPAEDVTALELFDPTNEIFHATATFAEPRNAHTATQLRDGRVMFAGGHPSSRAVEVYDPSDGSLSTAGEIQIPRSGHIAALLLDGRVLLAGGSITNPLAAEIYDPQTGTALPIANLVTNHALLDAIALLDGRVLLLGGNRAELFDPETELFSLTGPLVEARHRGRLTLLKDGLVLISGGGNAIGYVATTEVFDPVTDTFTAGPPMTRARNGHSAVLLLDGRALLAGGTEGSVLNSSELIALKVDSDNDGMEDDWELSHGFNPADQNDAIADADADGPTNLQEYLAGTDPRDPASNMRISTVQIDDSKVRIAFTSVVGKRYAVERSFDALDSSWEVVTNGIPGSGAVVQIFDSSAAGHSRGLYRVRLIP